MHGNDQRVQALDGELARVRDEFVAALDAVPADRLDRAPAGQWSPAQIVWHLAKVERGVARMIEAKVAALGPLDTVPAGPSPIAVLTLLDKYRFLDRTTRVEAPEGLGPPDRVDLVAERGRWMEGRAQLLRAAYAAGPRLASVRHAHPVFGPFDGFEWVLMVARHEQRHLLQLREVIAATL
jgi:hypothetical protein